MSIEHGNSLIHQLHRASQVADEVFTKAASDLDLTPRQLAVLAAVASEPGLSQMQIVKMTGIDRSTVADIVYRLIKSGFLKRARAKTDARKYIVEMTERGNHALKLSEKVVRKVDSELLSRLSEADINVFKRCLAKLSG